MEPGDLPHIISKGGNEKWPKMRGDLYDTSELHRQQQCPGVPTASVTDASSHGLTISSLLHELPPESTQQESLHLASNTEQTAGCYKST